MELKNKGDKMSKENVSRRSLIANSLLVSGGLIGVAASSNTVASTTTIAIVNTFATLGSTIAAVGDVVEIKGHTVAGFGGGLFIALSGSVSNDGGTQINSATSGIYWKRTNYSQLDVQMFGAVGDGTTNETTVIQNAVNAASGGSLFFPDTANSYLTGQITVNSNTTIFGANPTTTIKLITGVVTGFYISGKSNVNISSLTITTSGTDYSNAKAGILIYLSSYCKVENVIFNGMTSNGVSVYDSNYNDINNCTFTNWHGSLPDSADVVIYNNSNSNTVSKCYLFGGGDHGVLIQDPYTNATPTANKVLDCHVSQHNTHGITMYVTHAYNTKTIIARNTVYGILGTSNSGASGSGIYIQSGGGTIVDSNHVYNCNQSTTNFDSNGSACISVAIGEYATGELAPVLVCNNIIESNRGPGLVATTSNAPIVISGGVIRNLSTAAVRGEAVRLFNANRTSVSNVVIDHRNSNYAALSIVASSKAVDKIRITNVDIKTVSIGVQYGPIGTGTMSDMSLSQVTCAGGSGNALFANKVSGLRISDCNFASSGQVVQINACPKTKITQTQFESTSGTTSIYFVNTNTSSVVDESVDLAGIIENSGTGVNISQYGTSAPTNGYWAAGDRIIQRTPALGQPKGWRCTTTGSPGTWVSEGNL